MNVRRRLLHRCLILALLGGPMASAQTPQPASPASSPKVEAAIFGFTPARAAAQQALETRFDALIDPKDLDAWMQRFAAEPNHVGSQHGRANAAFTLAQLKAWGWDARIETFEVLYPTPITQSLEMVGGGPAFKARLDEPPVPGDPATARKQDQLPPYLAYQGDGDVTAEVVYVNQGMPADYALLTRMGVDVKGKIVIARYGGGWRGLKPQLAQEHGAVGCIIYSDPSEDGYAVDDPYPKGGQRPSDGAQRGSVQKMMLYPGDPLTPGIAATKDAKRLTRETAPTVLKIPALPISYADALPFLQALDGRVVPRSWRGALPITYHVGPGPARARLVVRSDWSLKTIYDVVGVMKGAELPDEWVLRGNHRDGWVYGASDPLSGHGAMLAEAQAIGRLAKAGFRPKRTLVYLSWDAEEPGLIGSTEWAELHAGELQQKAVAYLNSDNIERGYFSAGGSHALQHMVNQVMDAVIDPERGAPLSARLRARYRVTGFEESSEQAAKLAKIAAGERDLPIAALGSGSDYSAFLQHLGVATLNLGFGGEGAGGGVYHSAYDTYAHYTRFGDPGFVYGAAFAKAVGRMVLRLSEADAPPMRFSDTAETVADYLADLKRLDDRSRTRDDTLNRLLDADAFRLAGDPQRPMQTPERPAAVPALDFAALDKAVARLSASAADYDRRFAAAASEAAPATRAALSRRLLAMEQQFLSPDGLPDRPWYRHLLYAPGVLTGYGAKTLPGVREAIEADDAPRAAAYIDKTAAVITRYAAALDAAGALLPPASPSPSTEARP
jgi:N-acetylated-alpha-linked acidic dipeptidase